MMYNTSLLTTRKGLALKAARNDRCLAVGNEGIVSPRITEARDQARLRRVAMRGDDLVGVAAGDFGHPLELPGEAAGPGGGRAQFDDEIADLRFRHGGADAVPAAPAFSCIEA